MALPTTQMFPTCEPQTDKQGIVFPIQLEFADVPSERGFVFLSKTPDKPCD